MNFRGFEGRFDRDAAIAIQLAEEGAYGHAHSWTRFEDRESSIATDVATMLARRRWDPSIRRKPDYDEINKVHSLPPGIQVVPPICRPSVAYAAADGKMMGFLSPDGWYYCNLQYERGGDIAARHSYTAAWLCVALRIQPGLSGAECHLVDDRGWIKFNQYGQHAEFEGWSYCRPPTQAQHKWMMNLFAHIEGLGRGIDKRRRLELLEA